MALSKKHYKQIASVVSNVVDNYSDSAPVARKAIGEVIIAIANVFALDNPNFDKRRFYDACLSREVK